MKRDVEIIELPTNIELVIAVDNSGAIGMKPDDHVSVPYETVSYYNFRVAWMECVSAGAQPISIILHNFSGDQAWDPLVRGVEQGMKEVGVNHIKVTGSTESNFPLSQSAVGLVIVGQREKASQPKELKRNWRNNLNVAVVGSPLVGQELLDKGDVIAPLNLFQSLSEMGDITMLPVGSKGILYELNQIFGNQSIKFDTDLDLKKSSGPATCFIIVYENSLKQRINEKCGKWLHKVALSPY